MINSIIVIGLLVGWEAHRLVRGQVVNEGQKLVPYNTKLEASTKALMSAIVQVQKLAGGQRELIERMLESYEAKYPHDVSKAKEIVSLINK